MIIKYNSSNCEMASLGNIGWGGATDLALTPSGKLYGTNFDVLLEIDTVDATTTFIAYLFGGLSSGINNLTALNDDFLLAISDTELYRINTSNGDKVLIGSDPLLSQVSGDLTFYKGYFYFTKIGKELARLKINHSMTELISVESVGIMNTELDFAWGLITIGSSDCTSDNLKLIVFESGMIYEVNPENAHCTVYCDSFYNTSLTGAASKTESSFQIATSEVIMSNVFTPNGDGINDFLNPTSIVNTSEFAISIMNRWGNIVFESSDPDFMWNGTSKNSEECSDGVYFYRINYSDMCGEKYKLDGSFTLIR